MDNSIRRSYIAYNLSTIPPRARISSAKLTLYCVADDKEETYLQVDVHAVDDNSTEGTITWNNAPAIGSVVSSNLVGPKNQFYTWDIASYVQSEYESDKIASMALRFPFDDPENLTGQPIHHRDFGSREAPEDFRPCVEITCAGPPPRPPQPRPPSPSNYPCQYRLPLLLHRHRRVELAQN